jgi:hypothetical protein
MIDRRGGRIRRASRILPAAGPAPPVHAATRIVPGGQEPADRPELVEWAVLQADHFRPGPASGHFIRETNGRTPPFTNQPIQGFSSVLAIGPRRFLVLSDNGFGAKENSADYVLALYEIEVIEARDPGRHGEIEVRSTVELSDPERRLPFPIVADAERYPGSEIPVDPEIRARKLLTGADLDVESFRKLPDGTCWLGDEFGPFLIHVDASGHVLDVPALLEGAASPQDPLGRPATLPRSGGFEGMSVTADGRHLLAMLEKPVAVSRHEPESDVGPDDELSDDGRLLIAAFDPIERRFTGRSWHYRLDPAATAIGDFAPVEGSLHLVIERDDGQGPTARHKKVYLMDLETTEPDGSVGKVELLDLLAVPDPNDLNGDGETVFRFPFHTIEAVALVDPRTLVILNDNNYPFGRGRPESTAPDANELLRVRFPQPIRDYVPVPSP